MCSSRTPSMCCSIQASQTVQTQPTEGLVVDLWVQDTTEAGNVGGNQVDSEISAGALEICSGAWWRDRAGVNACLTKTGRQCVCCLCFLLARPLWFLYRLSTLCAESGGCPRLFQSQPGPSDCSLLSLLWVRLSLSHSHIQSSQESVKKANNQTLLFSLSCFIRLMLLWHVGRAAT